MFLLPPFSSWAFTVLNTAPLTRLDLVDVELSFTTSGRIYGALTIPTLEHLRNITRRSHPYTLFSEFLSRHSAISTFEFISPPEDVNQLPITTLPALVSLICDPHNIENLLALAGVFPKLAHVRVVIELSIHNRFMFDAVENSLARAVKRLTKQNLRLCLDVLPISEYDNSVQLGPVPNDLSNYPVLSRVREIIFGFPFPGVIQTSILPTWLSTFPLLEHIGFLDTPIGLDDKLQISLLRGIAQHCAGIRTVKIGDDTRNISGWLSLKG